MRWRLQISRVEGMPSWGWDEEVYSLGQSHLGHSPHLSPEQDSKRCKITVTCQAEEGDSKVCALTSAWNNVWIHATSMGARG